MRNCIVTGASRGLGLAIAQALAADGERVIGIARQRTEAFDQAAAQVREAGRGELVFQAYDLGDTAGIAALVASLRQQHGQLWALINNAGIGTAGVLSSLRTEQIETLVRINTLAPIVLSKYVLRSMMSQRAGRIVNMASVVVSTGFSGLSVYAATKASLVGFTRSLAREVGQLGITVNAIAPGFAATEMTATMDDSVRDKIAHRSALRRLIEPSDVAAAVRYLLSDAAANVTGITLTVDAGSTA